MRDHRFSMGSGRANPGFHAGGSLAGNDSASASSMATSVGGSRRTAGDSAAGRRRDARADTRSRDDPDAWAAMFLSFMSSSPLFLRRSYRSRHGSHAALDLGSDEFELARRKTESFREADRTTVVDQYDQAVFTVEQPVDQFMNPASVITQCLSKGPVTAPHYGQCAPWT
jgi:hypothetical protein